jgi:hypothetical protein
MDWAAMPEATIHKYSNFSSHKGEIRLSWQSGVQPIMKAGCPDG